MNWEIGGRQLTSRLFLGTALYPSLDIMQQAVHAAHAEVITVSLRRQSENPTKANNYWDYIKSLNCHLLPNTAGCRNAKEAITTAEMAREIFDTRWIKLEVIGDDYTLQADPFALIEAAKELIQQGFTVFPYCTDDLIVCQRLFDLGCNILMPWAAPIGTGQGVLNPYAIKTIRQRIPEAKLIIDAGIGTPSHATFAMELGCDGVLLNSAVALANNPVKMATAFSHAIQAGRIAYQAGTMHPRDLASPSTPTIDTPFWHQELAHDE